MTASLHFTCVRCHIRDSVSPMGSAVRNYGMRVVLALSILLFGGAAMVATQADAATRTVDVPTPIEFRVWQPDPGGCEVRGLISWPEMEGAIGWTLNYTFNGKPRSETLSPPFHDHEFESRGWAPAEGMHWYAISRSGKFHMGGAPVNCDEILADLPPLFSEVKVTITLQPATRIAGVVKARDGSPLSGIRVRAGGRGDLTDAKGRYVIEVPGEARTYRVRTVGPAFAFRPRGRQVTVEPGKTSRVSFRARAYAIEVIVIQNCKATPGNDADKKPCKPRVKGAKAAARKVGSAKTQTVVTRPDGTALILVKDAGTYRVWVSYNGKRWTRSARVTSGKATVRQNVSRSLTRGRRR